MLNKRFQLLLNYNSISLICNNLKGRNGKATKIYKKPQKKKQKQKKTEKYKTLNLC